MPPQLLFDISKIDLNHLLFDQQAIRETNLQRGDMEHLNGIVKMDIEGGEAIGFKDVRPDEFWVAGHIPGRPILPGVLMIEAAAQLASFVARYMCGWKGFIGFGGVDGVKFRAPVEPGVRMYILAKRVSLRHRRLCCAVQGLVNGNVVFEGEVVGTQV
jgi:3-hydroxyacyl-[acyl-carrier-protein] dehydratase